MTRSNRFTAIPASCLAVVMLAASGGCSAFLAPRDPYPVTPPEPSPQSPVPRELDLAVACHQLSDRPGCDGDPLTVAVLERPDGKTEPDLLALFVEAAAEVRGGADYARRLLAMMRTRFGGHAVHKRS